MANSEADVSRLVCRLSSAYLIRCMKILSDFHEGEVVTAIVFQAIVTANTAHLEDAATGVVFAGVDEACPDELRRPVSVLAISEGLGFPFETTRRHVSRLIAAGRCRRVKKGVIVPGSAVSGDDAKAFIQMNLLNVKRLMRELRKVGFEAD